MSSSQAPGIGPLVLAFVAGCALATGIALVLSRGAAPPVPAVVPTDDANAALALEIQAMRAKLDGIERSLALQDARPEAREPAPPSSSHDAELARMQQKLAEHATALSEMRARPSSATDRGVSLAERKQRSPEPNWHALNAWLDVAREDKDAASALVQLLTYDDVLARYGAPTIVRPATISGSDDSRNLSAWWTYARGAENGDGQPEVQILFGFADGRVVQSRHFERDD
ncbi:MAG: hypothetical protein ACKVWV_13470 [Planctomycetota bacterium]